MKVLIFSYLFARMRTFITGLNLRRLSAAYKLLRYIYKMINLDFSFLFENEDSKMVVMKKESTNHFYITLLYESLTYYLNLYIAFITAFRESMEEPRVEVSAKEPTTIFLKLESYCSYFCYKVHYFFRGGVEESLIKAKEIPTPTIFHTTTPPFTTSIAEDYSKVALSESDKNIADFFVPSLAAPVIIWITNFLITSIDISTATEGVPIIFITYLWSGLMLSAVANPLVALGTISGSTAAIGLGWLGYSAVTVKIGAAVIAASTAAFYKFYVPFFSSPKVCGDDSCANLHRKLFEHVQKTDKPLDTNDSEEF